MHKKSKTFRRPHTTGRRRTLRGGDPSVEKIFDASEEQFNLNKVLGKLKKVLNANKNHFIKVRRQEDRGIVYDIIHIGFRRIPAYFNEYKNSILTIKVLAKNHVHAHNETLGMQLYMNGTTR